MHEVKRWNDLMTLQENLYMFINDGHVFIEFIVKKIEKYCNDNNFGNTQDHGIGVTTYLIIDS